MVDPRQGFLLVVLSPEALGAMMQQMRYGEHYRVFLAPALVIGIYLTWAGFTAPADLNASATHAAIARAASRCVVNTADMSQS